MSTLLDSLSLVWINSLFCHHYCTNHVRVFMCVCAYVCCITSRMHVFVYLCVHAWVLHYACMHVCYIMSRVRVCVCACVCVDVHACMCVTIRAMCVYLCPYVHACVLHYELINNSIGIQMHFNEPPRCFTWLWRSC